MIAAIKKIGVSIVNLAAAITAGFIVHDVFTGAPLDLGEVLIICMTLIMFIMRCAFDAVRAWK